MVAATPRLLLLTSIAASRSDAGPVDSGFWLSGVRIALASSDALQGEVVVGEGDLRLVGLGAAAMALK